MHDGHHKGHHQTFDFHTVAQRVDVRIAGGQTAIDYYAALDGEAGVAREVYARFEADGG